VWTAAAGAVKIPGLGTAMGSDSDRGGYGFETGMGTLRSPLSADGTAWSPLLGAFFFGGGGGTSEDSAHPWYQTGVVPSSLDDMDLPGSWPGPWTQTLSWRA
jgi:hypothetical protein